MVNSQILLFQLCFQNMLLLPCHSTHFTDAWTNMATLMQLWSTQPLCFRFQHFCTYTKIQPTATNTLHIIAKFVPKQNMPSNAKYANYFMCRYHTTVSVCIPSINSMQSTLSPQALVYLHFILLAYAPEQICLSHCACTSHCTHNVVYM